jgi:hypothetical protein
MCVRPPSHVRKLFTSIIVLSTTHRCLRLHASKHPDPPPFERLDLHPLAIVLAQDADSLDPDTPAAPSAISVLLAEAARAVEVDEAIAATKALEDAQATAWPGKSIGNPESASDVAADDDADDAVFASAAAAADTGDGVADEVEGGPSGSPTSDGRSVVELDVGGNPVRFGSETVAGVSTRSARVRGGGQRKGKEPATTSVRRLAADPAVLWKAGDGHNNPPPRGGGFHTLLSDRVRADRSLSRTFAHATLHSRILQPQLVSFLEKHFCHALVVSKTLLPVGVDSYHQRVHRGSAKLHVTN